MDTSSLKGQLVLVTGSTEGIGKAIAISFLKAGSHVIINSRDQSKVDQVVQELQGVASKESRESKIYGVASDVSTKEGCDKLTEYVLKTPHKHLDVLVNNVGVFVVKDFFETTDEEWTNWYNINVMSGVRLAKSFLKSMLDRNSGRIIFISSETGMRPIKYMIHYSMTKTAQISIARGLAELTQGTKVTVNSVLPGPTWTPGVETYLKQVAEHKNVPVEDAVKLYFKENEPTSLIQRYIQPEEIGSACILVAINGAINGTALRVEGGIIRSL